MPQEQEIDTATGLAVFRKRPGEEVRLRLDCCNFLLPGSTVASVESVTVAPSGGLAASSPEASGRFALITVTGGSDGTDYEATVKFTDSDGNRRETDFLVRVRRSGLLA